MKNMQNTTIGAKQSLLMEKMLSDITTSRSMLLLMEKKNVSD